MIPPEGENPDSPLQPVRSLDRAISILEVLARRGTAGVTEIAAEVSLHKSTVFRLLATMEARGLVEQDSNRGRYSLADGIVRLAEGAQKRHDLALIGRDICVALAQEIGESVYIAIRDGRDVVSIDQVIGPSSLTTLSEVGRRDPLHASSCGKVFLADLPTPELQSYIEGGLPRLTGYTLVDPDALKADLALVSSRGYATTWEEQEPGLTAVAAPIRATDGHLVAAVSVSGPSFRLVPPMIPGIATHLIQAAAQIADRIG